MTGTMLWLEIQEGKDRMRALEYTHDLGGTAACVTRGVTKVSHFAHHGQREIEAVDTPYLFFGDSWFGSVKAASNVKVAGHHSCFLVKTGHSRSPKAFLEDKMKDFPGGTWITLEAKTKHEGVDLICIGYKYNKKRCCVLCYQEMQGKAKQESHTRPDSRTNMVMCV